MQDRHILQVDLLQREVIRIIVKKAIDFGVSESSAARMYMYLGMSDELKARGIPMIPKMVKKDWGNYTIEDYDREQEDMNEM